MDEDQLFLRPADPPVVGRARGDPSAIVDDQRLNQLPDVLRRRQGMIDAILAAIGLIIILGLGLFGLMLTGPA
jgi:hypothetical protein